MLRFPETKDPAQISLNWRSCSDLLKLKIVLRFPEIKDRAQISYFNQIKRVQISWNWAEAYFLPSTRYCASQIMPLTIEHLIVVKANHWQLKVQLLRWEVRGVEEGEEEVEEEEKRAASWKLRFMSWQWGRAPAGKLKPITGGVLGVGFNSPMQGH